MTWISKTTYVSGTTDAPAPDEALKEAALKGEPGAYQKWSDMLHAHKRHFTLHGHWNLISAFNYARRQGITSDTVEVEHRSADLNGKGRSGIDGRWLVSKDMEILPVRIDQDEQQSYSAEVDDSVWGHA